MKAMQWAEGAEFAKLDLPAPSDPWILKCEAT